MRLAAATAFTTASGAPAGAIARRPSGAIAISAVGSGSGGGSEENPPEGLCALAGAAPSTAIVAANAAAHRMDFTVSGLQLRFPVRFRGELTGSRWKDLRYAGHPAIRPN